MCNKACFRSWSKQLPKSVFSKMCSNGCYDVFIWETARYNWATVRKGPLTCMFVGKMSASPSRPCSLRGAAECTCNISYCNIRDESPFRGFMLVKEASWEWKYKCKEAQAMKSQHPWRTNYIYTRTPSMHPWIFTVNLGGNISAYCLLTVPDLPVEWIPTEWKRQESLNSVYASTCTVSYTISCN